MQSYINIGSFLLFLGLVISYEMRLYVNPIDNGLFLTVIALWIHDSQNASKISTDISVVMALIVMVSSKISKLAKIEYFECFV